MRCNPLRWLLGGILIIGLLGIMNLQGVLARIEAELLQQTRQALDEAGLSWAEVGFSGRDGLISGSAPDEQELRKAYEITSAIWGVREVSNRAGLVEEQKDYVWRATLREGRLKLTGYVPNEATRRAIIGTAKASFPDLEIQDRMQLARGAPNTEVWLGGVSFGLKQLSRLKPDAAVELSKEGLTVVGEAQDQDAYRALKSSLANGLPQGVALKEDRVIAPAVKPYVWGARLSSNQLQLGGYVPNEQAREQIFSAAQNAFPQQVIVDRMRIASGEPENLVAAAVGALGKLALLEEGKIEIKANQLSISGLATKEETAKQLRESVRDGIPESIKVDAEIDFKEPTIPTVSPYTVGVVIEESSLRLSGYVPNEDARKALMEAAQSRFQSLTVVDELQLGAGAPDGLLTCVGAGLSALATLGNGRLEMSDAQLRLAAVTDDEEKAEAVRNELRASANRACELDLKLVVDIPPEPDLSWRAVAGDGQLVLEGQVPDEATKVELSRMAGELFPGVQLIDGTQIAATHSKKWVKVGGTALAILSRLRSGEARLEGQNLIVTGQAPDTAVAAFVEQQLRSLPKGYMGTDTVEVRSDAMIWAEQEAQRKAEAEAARRAAEEERLRAEEEARRAEEEAQRREQEAQSQTETEQEQFAASTTEQEQLTLEAAQARLNGSDTAEEQPDEAAEQARIQGEDDGSAPSTTHEPAVALHGPEMARPSQQHAALTTEADERCDRAIAGATLHGTVNFDRGSAKLREDGKTVLEKLAQVVIACPHVRLEIEGHADAEGSPDGNQKLSERRAKTAVDFLSDRGIPVERIKAVGYGATRPVAPNDTPESRALNRRVEIIIKDH